MSKYKAVCIDLDQTIANTEDYLYSSRNAENYEKTAEWHLYKHLKPYLKVVTWEHFLNTYKLAKEQVKELLPGKAASHSRYLYIQKLFENLNFRFRPDLVYDSTNLYWNHVTNNMELFPGALSTLETIKRQGLKIAVVTDLTADIQVLKLKKLGINQYVDYLVTSEEADADKPNPKVGDLMIKKVGVSKEEIIMIGNNPKTDIQLAHNIGVDSILFDFYSRYSGEERNSPTYYTNNISDILNLMNIKTQEYTDEKLVVFDMIGTLTTNPHLISDVFRSVIPNIERDLIKKHYEEYKVDNIRRETFWKNIGIENFEGLERKFLDSILLREGVLELLQKMEEKHLLAILSNIPKEWGHYIEEKYNLKNYFNEIVFSGDYKVKKPNHEIYKILVDKFPSIAPENVYFIDDDLGDLKSGKDYLMKTVWLKSDQVSDRYVPDYIIEDISDIEDIINQNP